jgi:serine phosphatase RsbU (regulator of sigma subunit)
LQAAVDQARIQRDLEVAREVQLSFLPQQLPQVEGYEFWADYEPANEVGGDYYDFIPLSSGRLAMTLGDVAGKGVPAALLMGRVATEARFHFLIQPDLARAVSGLNDSMSPQCSRMDRFVTFAAAVLDPATHTVTLVNAGHLSPLHYRHADRTWTECVPRRVSGLALGIMDGFAFESCTVALRPGDSILMFSDGVTESNNIKGEQFHTKERKGLDLALQNCGPGARSQIERLLRAVKQHSAGAKQNDDITVVALSRNV